MKFFRQPAGGFENGSQNEISQENVGNKIYDLAGDPKAANEENTSEGGLLWQSIVFFKNECLKF